MNWELVAERLVQTLAEALANPDSAATEKLEAAFQVASAYGVARLKPQLTERLGEAVASGPFAGMRFLVRASEGAYIPKLLGSYEAELHPVIEEAIGAGYDAVINIGCAEGYYAVGFAHRTGAAVHAFDINDDAQRLCRELAALNGVEDRVTVGQGFRTADFDGYAGRRVLVVCDIEGGEAALLDPAAAPVLREMDLLVEIHHVDGAWTSDVLFPRFEASHAITELRQQPRDAAQYPALAGLSDRDRFFALLERTDETRWAFLQARRPTLTA
jgi:hypothetical protein